MNRHECRAVAARARRNRAKHDAFYRDYVHHLPRVPVDAPPERGSVHYLCFHHDAWCRFYDTENAAYGGSKPDRHREGNREG
jgi:hypothetical protein